MALPFWPQKLGCTLCGMAAFGGLCSKCAKNIDRMMKDIGDTVHGQYRGANPQVHSNPSGPTYTGFTGAQYTMHPAAHVPAALGGGTRNLPIENAGIRAGEIIAYRCWVASRDHVTTQWRLRSTFANYEWPTDRPAGLDPEADNDYRGIKESAERFGSHSQSEIDAIRKKRLKVNAHGVRTGLHAFKTLSKMMTEFGGPLRYAGQSQFMAYGTIAMWGDVIEHEHGFRSEFARVTSIDDIDDLMNNEKVLKELRKTYGVEGKSHRDFKIGVGPWNGKE